MLHCTGGDLLIAVTTLVGSLLLLGTAEWPRARFHAVGVATLIAGVATTAFSEHINTARGDWSYSDLMPMLPGTGIGLSPLAQWIVVPILAFAAVRPAFLFRRIDLPIMRTTASRDTADQLDGTERRYP